MAEVITATDENSFRDVYPANQDRNISQMNASVNINSINVYQFMSEAYDGTGGFRTGTYLVKFSRETDFKSRMQLAYYKNYVKPVINAMVDPVFSQIVAREYDENQLFDQFIKDVDVCGTFIQDFTHTAITLSRKHGVVFIVMDNFDSEQQPSTIAEVQETRSFPYIYTKTADQVEDYKTDAFGNIEEITFFDHYEEKDVFYRKWTRQESILLKKEKNIFSTLFNQQKLKEVSKTVHGLGVVPVISIFSEMQQDKSCLLPNPPLYDVARVNWQIFNMSVEKRHQERCQAFSVFFCQGVPPEDLAIGEGNYINLPIGVTISPGYATPPSTTLEYLMKSEEQIRKELYLMVEQAGVIGIQQAESGISKSYDFEAKENTLKRTSVMAATLEEKVAFIFKLYTKEKFNYSVAYPVDFAPMGVDREIDRIEKILKISELNKTFKSKIHERLAKLYFADDSKETLDEILQSIKEDALESNNEESSQGDEQQTIDNPGVTIDSEIE